MRCANLKAEKEGPTLAVRSFSIFSASSASQNHLISDDTLGTHIYSSLGSCQGGKLCYKIFRWHQWDSWQGLSEADCLSGPTDPPEGAETEGMESMEGSHSQLVITVLDWLYSEIQ